MGFQMNFYICKEELEAERKGPSTTMCSAHDVEPLVLFCVQCDRAICIQCKLTKHDHHETEDLSEAAARCQSHLEMSKERLENTVSYLTTKSAEALDNIKAAKQKGISIKQEVNKTNTQALSLFTAFTGVCMCVCVCWRGERGGGARTSMCVFNCIVFFCIMHYIKIRLMQGVDCEEDRKERAV